MKNEFNQGKRLRIYVDENDRYEGEPLYEAIVHAAYRCGMAGCTVLKGFEGYGASHELHTAKIVRLTEKLPMLIEIVDTETNIRSFIPHLSKMVIEGVMTMEDVAYLMIRPSSGSHGVD